MRKGFPHGSQNGADVGKNTNQQLSNKTDTDLYRFGKLILYICDAKREPKWEMNCSYFFITWKRLNMLEATTHDCLRILWVRLFDCSTEKVSNRNQKRNRNQARMTDHSCADCCLILDRLCDLKASTNQLKTKPESIATKNKQPERPRKRQREALTRRGPWD